MRHCPYIPVIACNMILSGLLIASIIPPNDPGDYPDASLTSGYRHWYKAHRSILFSISCTKPNPNRGTDMKRLILLFILATAIGVQSLSADCRGCCSRRGGLVCVSGVTRCADGSALTQTCLQKACEVYTGQTNLHIRKRLKHGLTSNWWCRHRIASAHHIV